MRKFLCRELTSGWPTFAKRGNAISLSPLISWNTTEFGAEYTPEKRCEIVSRKLTEVVAQKGGILGGLDFTTGKVDDGQTVVCLVRQDQKSCDRNNQAIKLNSNDADAYYNRRIARDDLGDKQGAIADYNQAIKINPNYANAYYSRSLVH